MLVFAFPCVQLLLGICVNFLQNLSIFTRKVCAFIAAIFCAKLFFAELRMEVQKMWNLRRKMRNLRAMIFPFYWKPLNVLFHSFLVPTVIISLDKISLKYQRFTPPGCKEF